MGTKERVEILNKSNCVTNELLKRISNLEFEVERLENIIKEVREYIENAFATGEEIFKVEILEILDKENKE